MSYSIKSNSKKQLTNNQLNVIIVIEREVMKMSYSPFAVLGTSARIKASKDRMKESQPAENKEEKKIDYTEQFRRTYFPHLAKKQLTKQSISDIIKTQKGSERNEKSS